jgi:hypothetical protein
MLAWLARQALQQLTPAREAINILMLAAQRADETAR